MGVVQLDRTGRTLIDQFTAGNAAKEVSAFLHRNIFDVIWKRHGKENKSDPSAGAQSVRRQISRPEKFLVRAEPPVHLSQRIALRPVEAHGAIFA